MKRRNDKRPTDKRPMIRLGAKTKWGKVAAVAMIGGERYYFMCRRGEVAMIDAHTAERPTGMRREWAE